MSNLLKNLLFALGLAVILWLGYVLFLKNADENLLSQSQGAFTEQAELETQQLLATLQELRSFSVEGTLFSDRDFASLQDFRVDLGSEPAGRQNPFEPIK